MLRAIVRFAIRFRGVVVVVACLLVVYGVWTLIHARLSVFPEFAPPTVTVQTEAPGLSPEQVEALVTRPVEVALNGATGVATMRSRSIQGLSVVTLVFSAGSDIYRDRQIAAGRLGTVSLPAGVPPPTLLPLTSTTGVVLEMGLASATRPLMDVYRVARWNVKPQLLSVPGVADVSIFSLAKPQLQIQVHPQALVRFDLSLDDIVAAARRATGVRGGGFIATPNQKIVLTPHGQALTPQALAQTVLGHRNGQTLHLGDVADVRYASAPPIGAAAIDGRPGVLLVVEEQHGADTVAVTRALDERVRQLAPTLRQQGLKVYPALFRPANFIHTALHNLAIALAIGAALVISVLFVFLANARAALVSALAIPLSLLTAIILLNRFGAGINVMTLGGLAVALGEVVDDAIIDVQNILRRLRENRLKSRPLGAFRVVFKASLEVRSAVVYATFIVALVFVPVLTLTGVAGRLFSPLALAYIAAIMASLAVALTVTPALCCILLARRPLKKTESRLAEWLVHHYRRWLGSVQGHGRLIAIVVVPLCAAALIALLFFNSQLLPSLHEDHYIVHMQLAPGASLEAGLRLGRRVSIALLEIPGVRSVALRLGRAELIADPVPSYAGELGVDLKPMSGAAQARVLQDINATLAGFAGANFSVNTFLTERINETISGYTAPVVVNIFGNDLGALDRAAQQVAAALTATPGARGVRVQAPQGSPKLGIRLRGRALARWGIAPTDALAAIETAYQGAVVAQVYRGTQITDVSVIFPTAARDDPAAVGALMLKNPDGILVPLADVADIRLTTGRFLVLHQAAQRVQTVTANLAGRSLSAFVADAERRIHARVKLPPGTYVVFSGAAQERSRATRDLMLNSAIVAVAIVLLLFIALGSLRALGLVLVNLPFAFVGGVLMVLVTGDTLSLGSLIGFVTLFGITVRNSIMLISHYQHLVREEGMTWGPEAAIRGASERLVPILMTALVTALGLLPLAIGSGAPGREIEGAMAIVILGGLVSSTLLNLLLLPTLALNFGRFDAVRDEWVDTGNA